MNFFSSCFFGFHGDRVKVLIKGKLHFQCESCHADLGAVLPNQKFKRRKEPKKAKVFRIAKRAS